MSVTIREVTGDELVETAFPLTSYAFGRSPTPEAVRAGWSAQAADWTASTLVAFDGDRPVATASRAVFTQNVRGVTVGCTGVAGVAAHPDARRTGHVRALMTQLHRHGRDAGDTVAALYPFRPSFYARFGYVGLATARRVRLRPAGMADLRALPGSDRVSLHPTSDPDAWADFLGLQDEWLARRHGVVLDTSHEQRVSAGSHADAMLALVRRDGRVVGGMQFRTTGFGAELDASRFLVADASARLALLQWLAGHADQYSSFVLSLSPGETPELWYTDAAYEDETKVGVPTHGAPMARVLDLPGLAGAQVGSGRVVVEVDADPLVAGRWALGGDGGRLLVEPTGDEPAAVLAMAGLSAFVYGCLSADEVRVRGLGRFDDSTARALDTLFDRRNAYVLREF